MSAAQIGDGGAVAALLLPSAIRTQKLHVAVELRGEHTRGMTVCDLRPCVFEPDRPMGMKNADVCIDVDGEELARLYIDRVLRPPSGTGVPLSTTETPNFLDAEHTVPSALPGTSLPVGGAPLQQETKSSSTIHPSLVVGLISGFVGLVLGRAMTSFEANRVR
jgi:hypothetical protein